MLNLFQQINPRDEYGLLIPNTNKEFTNQCDLFNEDSAALPIVDRIIQQ
jgi:hypothetical protein